MRKEVGTSEKKREIESDLAYLWQIAAYWEGKAATLSHEARHHLPRTHTHTTTSFPTPPHQGQLQALPRILSYVRQHLNVKGKKFETLLTYIYIIQYIILTLYTALCMHTQK